MFGEAFKSLEAEGLDELGVLTLLLAVEAAKGEHSFWHAYVGSLPTEYQDPLWWEPEALAEIQVCARSLSAGADQEYPHTHHAALPPNPNWFGKPPPRVTCAGLAAARGRQGAGTTAAAATQQVGAQAGGAVVPSPRLDRPRDRRETAALGTLHRGLPRLPPSRCGGRER